MSFSANERRKYPRVYFDIEKMPQAHILIPRYEGVMCVVCVMNMSKQGLGFIMAKDQNITINKGDHTVISKFQRDDRLKDIQHVYIVVRWTIENKELEHNIYGCEFLNMPSNFQFLLNTFIDQIIADKIESSARYEAEPGNQLYDQEGENQ